MILEEELSHHWIRQQDLPGRDTVKKDRKYSPYDYFMACFPNEQFKLMVELTSIALWKRNNKPLSYGELLKWFGIPILITNCEYCNSIVGQSPEISNMPAQKLEIFQPSKNTSLRQPSGHQVIHSTWWTGTHTDMP